MIDKTNFYLNIGEKIKELRLSRGFTMEQLSEASGLGLDKSSIFGIEKGRQQLSVFQLHLISKALDKNLGEIVNLAIKNFENTYNLGEVKNKADQEFIKNL